MWEGINEGKRRYQWKNLPKLRTPLGVMHSGHLSWNAVGGVSKGTGQTTSEDASHPGS